MFERKNQNILSKHYSKLVDHSVDEADDNGDEFITLKRADHDLPESGLPESENMSKRKLKMGRAKRAIVKYSGLAKKLVFDDKGNPHEMYEMADAEEFFKDGVEVVNDAGKKFAAGERGKMREADVIDKEEAREKKREKKRKRKDRERGVGLFFLSSCLFSHSFQVVDEGTGPMRGPPLESDGHHSPTFDLSADEEELAPPPPKRSMSALCRPNETTIEDDEELALRLLRGTR
jgi:ATP-dependent RNA helicase DDX10/DBP4